MTCPSSEVTSAVGTPASGIQVRTAVLHLERRSPDPPGKPATSYADHPRRHALFSLKPTVVLALPAAPNRCPPSNQPNVRSLSVQHDRRYSIPKAFSTTTLGQQAKYHRIIRRTAQTTRNGYRLFGQGVLTTDLVAMSKRMAELRYGSTSK